MPPTKPTKPRLPKSFEVATSDLEDEADLSRVSYEKVDLSGREVGLAEFAQCRFVDVDFSGTALNRALFSDCVLESCNLANLSCDSSSMVRVEITGSRGTGLRWTDGAVRHTVFSRCRMDLAAFWGTKFEQVRFEGCNLGQADFADADLSGVEFVDCDLTSVRLSGTIMTGARLTGCRLDGIRGVTSLRGAVIDADDLLPLTYALADGLGIVIEDRSSE